MREELSNLLSGLELAAAAAVVITRTYAIVPASKFEVLCLHMGEYCPADSSQASSSKNTVGPMRNFNDCMYPMLLLQDNL
jgi:hypothetical protein